MATIREFLTTLGRIIQGYGRFTSFGARTVYHLVTSFPRRRVLFPLAYRIGVQSLPVVLATGLSIGMVLAVQMYYQLHRLGSESTSGPIINISMIREIGPVLAAIILAGRVGGAMAAELGTMKITEQIDAIRTLGVNPIRYLVCPRFLSCFFLIPILTIFSGFIGVIGGYIMAVKVYRIDEAAYWYQSSLYVGPFDICAGVIKSFFFGALIALICCYRGFNARGGAEGVGRATTDAFVDSFVSILVANFFLVVALRRVGVLLFPD
jgi:phospholipid/cholesterol/gamma-HCH transport system permease protein